MKFGHFAAKFDKKFFAITAIVSVVLVVISVFLYTPKAVEETELSDSWSLKADGLFITEIVTSNNGVYCSKDAGICDYIELHNSSESDINLEGYGLSDKAFKIKYTFGNVVIPAGEYLVVPVSSSAEQGSFTAPFSLSSKGGEKVILTNSKKKVIDSCKTVAMPDGYCLIRSEDGDWYVCSETTPGCENSKKGRETYFSRLYDADCGRNLVVNEILINNDGNLATGTSKGFVELKNIGSEVIQLSDYYISSDKERPFRKQLQEETLEAGELKVLYFGEGDTQDYLGFNVPSCDGNVILASANGIDSVMSYTESEAGRAMIYSDGIYCVVDTVSPGYSNDAVGMTEYLSSRYNEKTGGLIINEVMNSNWKYMGEDGEYYDWIEFYNSSEETIDLSHYSLSESCTDSVGWSFPDKKLKPGQFFTVLCSGDTSLTGKYIHTSMRISFCEGIYLYEDGMLVDCLHVGNVPTGYSYGITEEGLPGYMSSPSPGEENNSGSVCVAPDVIFSVAGGVYDNVEGVYLELYGPGEIYYTTDGSKPNSSDKHYTGPIYLDDTTVVKAVAVMDGMKNSTVVTNSYIINEYHTVPVISLSLDPSDFSYINAGHRGIQDAYVEFFEGDDGFKSFCGMSIYGGSSKHFAKKNFAMRFEKAYGARDIEYPVFENRDNCVYGILALRAGSQAMTTSIFKDELVTSLLDDGTDVLTAAYKTCIVYVNGNYRGIYNLREKKSTEIFEDNYNVQIDDISLINSVGIRDRGTASDIKALRSYCASHNLAKEEYYNYVAERIVVEDWIDFFIAQMWSANYDYFNIGYYNSKEIDGGRIRCYFYDLDLSMNSVNKNCYYAFTSSSGFPSTWVNWEGERIYGIDNTIIRSLFESEKFRELYLERLAYHMATTYSEETVLARIEELYQTYLPEIAREQRKWDRTVSHWEECVERLRNFARKRPKVILKQTKNYYDLTDEEMEEIFGETYTRYFD